MSRVEKISVALTAELAEQMRDAVESGEYATASEVVRDALRAWSSKRSEDSWIKRMWEEGLASGEPRERRPLEEFLKEARARLAKTRAA